MVLFTCYQQDDSNPTSPDELGPCIFIYYSGVFYIRKESTEEYEVAAPPEGAMVDDLPSDSAEIKIDGQPYIAYDGAIYKAGNY